MLGLLVACTSTPVETIPPTPEPSTTPAPTSTTAVPTASLPDPTEPLVGALIEADDPNWLYTGRNDHTDPLAPQLIWSGASVTGWFDATTVVVHLEDLGDNWVNVMVDGGTPTVLRLSPGVVSYQVATELEPGLHRLEIHKRTESGDGPIVFHGVTADGVLAEPEPPRLGIEFYGDSITSGYSIECDCDLDAPSYKNHYLTYGALTARNLDAEVRAISLSGIGLVNSWWYATMFDHWRDVQLGDAAWDFAWQPEVVVVNLGQNDYWLGTGNRIIPAYRRFHGELRKVYPDAEIFFVLGNMDAVADGSPMPDFVDRAVTALQEAGDEQVHSLVFSFNGHGRHPVVADHEIMAKELTARILEVRPDLAP